MTPWTLLVAGALLLWFTLPTLLALTTVWSSYDYSHGYLVLGLTVLLVVVELRRARLRSPAPSWAGFVYLTTLALLVLAARVTTTQTVELLAWPLFWVAAIWAWTGWDNARRLVAPFSYLLVAIPVWSIFVEPLRRLTVLIVSMWIRMAGMPAFIEGNLIHVPSGTFEVLGGCAGLRYALVALALTVFAGLFHYRHWRPTAVLILFGLLLVAFGNWVRVFITVAVGLSPERWVSTWIGEHHTLFGWIVFVLFLMPLAVVHRKLQSSDWTESSDSPTAREDETAVPSRRSVVYASCAVLGLVTWLTLAMDNDGAESQPVSLETPEVAGWTREAAWQDSRLPVSEGALASGATWYANGAGRVGAYIAAFANQAHGREVASLANSPTSTSAVIVARQQLAVPAVSGAAIPFLELELFERGDQHRLVWIGRRIAGRSTASDLAAKFLQLRGAIRGRHDAQALVLTVVCDGGCDEARRLLSSFAAEAAESLYERAERTALPRHRPPTAASQ